MRSPSAARRFSTSASISALAPAGSTWRRRARRRPRRARRHERRRRASSARAASRGRAASCRRTRSSRRRRPSGRSARVVGKVEGEVAFQSSSGSLSRSPRPPWIAVSRRHDEALRRRRGRSARAAPASRRPGACRCSAGAVLRVVGGLRVARRSAGQCAWASFVSSAITAAALSAGVPRRAAQDPRDIGAVGGAIAVELRPGSGSSRAPACRGRPGRWSRRSASARPDRR